MKVIKEYKLFIPLLPVPASRVRVTRWGTFYLKNYENFRQSCKAYLKKISKEYPTSKNVFRVKMDFICYKPKKPTHNYPRGDLTR